VALARFAAAASVAGENREARREELLSIAEARKVVACLAADRAAWPAVVPRPNPTLRPDDAEGFLTFWRPATPRREGDEEVRSRVRRQPVLDIFLAAAGRGTLAVPDLLAAVAAESGLALADLEGFLARLAEAGVLIVEVEPPYNARRPLAHLAAALAAAGCEPPWAPELQAIEQAVDALPSLPAPARLPAMDAIAARLDALPHRRPLGADEIFRVDTASGLEVALPSPLLAELRGAVGRYVRLFAAMYPEAAFREGLGRRFLSRFPAGEDVPLLDLYHGLFEPEPEARPSAFPPAPPGDPAAVATAGCVRDLLAQRAREAAGAAEVALDDAFFSAAGALPIEPDWAAGVLFQVASPDLLSLSAGRYRLVLNAFFGAGIALARFAWLLGPGDGEPSPAIVRELARYAAPLAPPGALVAEITYNHLGRSANAGLRPAVLPDEIELPGERASAARPIPLADLTVRWDVRTRRFLLRSLARNAEVVPVISSGISPEGFVAFLLQIGRQGLQPLALFPGFEVAGITHWPRFTLGRVVLLRQRWTFPPGTAPEVPGDGGDSSAAEFFARVARWRRASHLPRHLFLHTDDDPKPYYADLDSPLSAELLRRTLAPGADRPPPTLHATEMLPGPDELWVRDAAGRYAAEFLVQMSGP
jgi:hypothetical protein